MSCQDFGRLLHAYADDELDLATSLRVDAHLQSCAHCRQALDGARAVKMAIANSALRYSAPPDFRLRIAAEITPAVAIASPAPTGRASMWRAIAVAASLLLVIGLGFQVFRGSSVGDADGQLVLAAHIRSMQLPDHLIDVVSTDQHTVKPWFDGKLDFAPPVVQLADKGFPLAGGRLDYLHDRPVAALVYHCGKHIINLFVWPAQGEVLPALTTRQGYNLLHWTQAGMNFWAASDVNPSAIEEFADLIRAAH